MPLPNCPICNSNENVLINLTADKLNETQDRVIVNNTVYSDYSCMDCDEDFNNEDLRENN
ncbi:MAG: hypothetical protein M1419_00430 [Bacteroidetes bacterium]|nr:hypothetical protein [Bacteroidota bacterium]